MRIPFGERARRGDDEPGFGRRRLECLRLPAVESLLHRSAIVLAAEQLEHAVAVMREIRVQPYEAAVAAAVKSGDLVPQLRRGLALDAQIALAAKFDCGIAHRNADVLLPPGTQTPQFSGRERRCRDGGLRRGTDR